MVEQYAIASKIQTWDMEKARSAAPKRCDKGGTRQGLLGSPCASPWSKPLEICRVGEVYDPTPLAIFA